MGREELNLNKNLFFWFENEEFNYANYFMYIFRTYITQMFYLNK